MITSKLITILNTKLPLHLNLPHPSLLRNQTHHPLPDILNLIILMQETDMALDGGCGIIPVVVTNLLPHNCHPKRCVQSGSKHSNVNSNPTLNARHTSVEI